MLSEHLKFALQDMYYDFMEHHLKVILVPQNDPPNIGACIRVASSSNCQWYRDLCSDFEAKCSIKYRKFKTKVKRKEIERILNCLIAGKSCQSKYADWILTYAQQSIERYRSEVPF